MSHRWLAVGVPARRTSGGSVRAYHVFQELIRRMGAGVMYRPDLTGLRQVIPRHALSLLPGASVAAAEFLPLGSMSVLRRAFRLRVLDLHDHPMYQLEALGMPAEAQTRRYLQRLMDANLDAFDRILVISPTFADLCGIDPERRVLVPNGSDTRQIRPAPFPLDETVGMISGAAPGRGIELLLEAFRHVTAARPQAVLHLALVATDEASAHYLRELRQTAATEPSVTIQEVPYRDLTSFLGRMRVLVIPHPPGEYMDSALPVKLFDSMAAGRPVVATPRVETARLLTEEDAGIASASDRADDLAEAIARLLSDERLSQRLGANARAAAERSYDWSILSARVSEAVFPDASTEIETR
jgi:glycosyltransferase involved in cell wall biosynthesis